jgi:quaternary ammonium compound-resistance protein SugE
MPWLYLIVAGMLEIAWATGLKFTDGLTRLWPSLLTLAVSFVSFVLLAQAMKTIPLGTSYAVWTGIGVMGTATLGILLAGDPATPGRLACIGLILIGIVGLKVTG